jgi:serine/threonine protein kinase
VYKGKLRGVDVAVKKLSLKQIDERKINQFKKEVAIMRYYLHRNFLFFFLNNLYRSLCCSKLRHPNVLLFMGACCEPNNLMIVTELMPRGSVYDLLRNPKVQSILVVFSLSLSLSLARARARSNFGLTQCFKR